jgi:hypothetical protein
MTDDRYTVDDPPGDGGLVYAPFVHDMGLGESWFRYDIASENARVVLERGLLHRTPESAQAHARRMLMADDILEALETLTLAVRRPGTAQNLAVLGANRVIARARGEVEG